MMHDSGDMLLAVLVLVLCEGGWDMGLGRISGPMMSGTRPEGAWLVSKLDSISLTILSVVSWVISYLVAHASGRQFTDLSGAADESGIVTGRVTGHRCCA